MEMKNNPSKKGDIARSKSPQRSPVRVATATLSELGKKKETCFDNIVHVAKKVDPSLLSWTSLVVGERERKCCVGGLNGGDNCVCRG